MIFTFPPQKSSEQWCYNTFSLNVFDLYYVKLHSLYTDITEFSSSTPPPRRGRNTSAPPMAALQDSPQAHTNAVQLTNARVNQWLFFQLSLLNAGTAFLPFYFLLPTTSFLRCSTTTYLILGSVHTKVARHMPLKTNLHKQVRPPHRSAVTRCLCRAHLACHSEMGPDSFLLSERRAASDSVVTSMEYSHPKGLITKIILIILIQMTLKIQQPVDMTYV